MIITAKVSLKATGEVGIKNHYPTNSFVTEIHGTPEEVKQYYHKGKIINMGLWYDVAGKEHEDDLMKITNCEIICNCKQSN